MTLKQTNSLNFIDLFSGAGGFSCGLELAGFTCLLGVDFDKYAMQTFAHNHKKAHAYCGDIRKLTTAKLKEILGDNEIHAIIGGPPCQGFSTVGLGNPEDERNILFREYCRIVKVLNPYFILLENVTGLLAKKNEKILKAILGNFQKMGYTMNVQVMAAEQYGVPERRRRTVLIGSRINHTVDFPQPTHHATIDGKIIPPVTVGEALKNLKTKSGKFYNHDLPMACLRSPLEEERLKRIPEGKGIRYEADEKAYLPSHLRLGIDWKNLRENRFRQTKYFRLDRKLPSPTIMTHRHTYYHPTECRFLTQREAAKLQSFPNDFVFQGPLSAQWRQIGNAVPPLLGKALGEHLKKLLQESVLVSKEKKKSLAPIHHQINSIRKTAFVYANKSKKGSKEKVIST